mmetsp:Transcript_16051/g.35206  ORF Transcript_16051/g.35206 Transcript_16051/m.35206 type:complete len:204 (+) Transcript_16051:163-774(+)
MQDVRQGCYLFRGSDWNEYLYEVCVVKLIGVRSGGLKGFSSSLRADSNTTDDFVRSLYHCGHSIAVHGLAISATGAQFTERMACGHLLFSRFCDEHCPEQLQPVSSSNFCQPHHPILPPSVDLPVPTLSGPLCWPEIERHAAVGNSPHAHRRFLRRLCCLCRDASPWDRRGVGALRLRSHSMHCIPLLRILEPSIGRNSRDKC